MAGEDWRAKMERQTDEVVARFVQENPDYAADAAQPAARGQANCVVFGRRGERRVVFKKFCEADRKGREVFALRHWRRTGLVPELLDETDELVVMSFVEGELIEDLIGRVDIDRAGRALGTAVAGLTKVPFEDAAARFAALPFAGDPLAGYFARILGPAREVCRRASAYGDACFVRSLDFIAAQRDSVLAQPPLLYNQDIRNALFVGERLSGFIDFELSWSGTEAMQLGSLGVLLRLAAGRGADAAALWRAISQGYGEGRGKALDTEETAACRAVALFLVWRDMTEYGGWRGGESFFSQDKNRMAGQHALDLRLLDGAIA